MTIISVFGDAYRTFNVSHWDLTWVISGFFQLIPIHTSTPQNL